jgi:hypothetical protein
VRDVPDDSHVDNSLRATRSRAARVNAQASSGANRSSLSLYYKGGSDYRIGASLLRDNPSLPYPPLPPLSFSPLCCAILGAGRRPLWHFHCEERPHKLQGSGLFRELLPQQLLGQPGGPDVHQKLLPDLVPILADEQVQHAAAGCLVALLSLAAVLLRYVRRWLLCDRCAGAKENA